MDTSFRTVYVENFPLNTSKIALQRLLNNFGHVMYIDLPAFEPEHPICRGCPKPKSKGYAFVEFSKKEAADKACQFFNDLEYIKLAASITEEQSTRGISQLHFLDPSLVHDISGNLEFRKLLLIRVMSKSRFQQLSKAYNERKLNSLIGAARLLMVT